MVKKAFNPLCIDFKKCIVDGCLLQIRNEKHIDSPDLTQIWTIEIDPKDSKLVVNFIRAKTQPYDPVSFTHVKRIKKTNDDKTRLAVIICSTEYIQERSKIILLLGESNVAYDNLNCQNRIPRQGPPTKELIEEWSRKYWPLTWCGNPNDQILNDYTFDIPFIKRMLKTISTTAKNEANKGNSCPIVTAFVNPDDKEHPIISSDRRTEKGCTPLEHSVMSGVKRVAEEKKEQCDDAPIGENHETDSIYLCLNFDVYTTHEPCSMCSMALIHSRIKRCIFIQPMKKTGSLKAESGDGYCMHNNISLNSKYEVFQWIGEEFTRTDVPQDICC